MRLQIKNSSGCIVEIDVAALTVASEGRIRRFSDPREAQLAYHICAASPKILTYEEIDIQILRPNNVGQQSDMSRQQYLHNKMSAIRKLFATVSDDADMIRTIRGQGYQLVDRWIVQIPREESPHESIAEVRDILAEVVALAGSLPLVERCDDEAEPVLVLDINDRSSEITALLGRYRTATDKLLDLVQHKGSREAVLYCSSLVEIMQSYVRIARQGQGIDEQTWKRLFKEELQQHFSVFITIVLTSLSTD